VSTTIEIPQNDLRAGYLAHKEAIDAAVAKVLKSGWYILGEEVSAFEKEFAAWLGASRAVGVANGTDALALILRAFDIGPGSSVVTVSHTAVATVAAIEMVGATPILVDIDADTYTMNAAELYGVLQTYRNGAEGVPPVKAVIPVHLYGHCAEVGDIMSLCSLFNLRLIEDCAQAHGARFFNKRLGLFGAAAAFSLYPTKNLGALGDGGVIAVNDPKLADRIMALRQYGWEERYISSHAGVNSRLDELQAAILRVKLKHLDAENERRRQIAARYDAALEGTGIVRPVVRERAEHVYHQYVVRTPKRDLVKEKLAGLGIGTNIHYPMPVHRQPAYLGRLTLGPSGCAVTEKAADEVLSLPMFPQMTDGQVDRVCEAVAGLKGMGFDEAA